MGAIAQPGSTKYSVVDSRSVMFCPQCKAEYRPGFTRCSDCDVDLVERLPEAGRGSTMDVADGSLWEVWRGEDQDECVSICERLKVAEIPFKVMQHRRQFLKGLERSFKIGVPPKFRSEAKEVIEKGRLDFTDEGADQRVMELQVEDDLVSDRDTDSDWEAKDWRPEHATVEVWSEATPRHSWMIESSLKENNIHARVETSDNGSRKIFVKPDDESRARKIVHEIKDGTPPK